MSRVSYLLKQSLFNFAYLILTMMTAAAISLIEITWLKMVLFVLNIALYATIVFFSSRAQGEKEKSRSMRTTSSAATSRRQGTMSTSTNGRNTAL